MIIEILLVVDLFLWFLTLVPVPQASQFAWANGWLGSCPGRKADAVLARFAETRVRAKTLSANRPAVAQRWPYGG